MIWGILLAAGQSTRMGRPKQLLDWHGRPLVRHVALQAGAADLAGLVVVSGAAAAAVRSALSGLELTIVENQAYASGQASSLQAGLRTLPAAATGAVIVLVDQPLVTTTLINNLVAAFRAMAPPPLALIPRYQGQRGNPVVLSRALFPALMQLQGDEGARLILRDYGDQVQWIDVEDPAVVTDIDTPEAYAALHNTA